MTTAVWYAIRATGVVSLILLTVTTVLGLLSASRVRTHRWPAFAQVDPTIGVHVVADDGTSVEPRGPSTSTRHIRQTPTGAMRGW